LAYTVPKLNDFSPDALDKAVKELLSALDEHAAGITSQQEYEIFRNHWRARKDGITTQVNELWLKAVSKQDRRAVGQKINDVIIPAIDKKLRETHERVGNLQILKRAREEGLDAKIDLARKLIEASERATRDNPQLSVLTIQEALRRAGTIDISLPGIRRAIGAEHPIIRTQNEIVAVFKNLGYSVAEGPVIETDYYNFEALNFPPNHPARDTQDTLFLANQESKPRREQLLLRTHTSPVQIRTMEKLKPPLRIVIPGKVHRNDPPDASHSPMFHQVEGLAVDTSITFGDLKGTLDHAMKALFGSNVKTSFRPSFFPFTEPSAEMFVSCFICGGSGKRGDGTEEAPCRPCKQTGWIEILGCGMVDPNVFECVKHNGYDPEKVSGFAFGMGVDRIAMLKYGLDDLQLFFQGDVRFLEQFV
jgi:phenylalanyl-tRNA synthetase alpha chain